MTAVWWHRLDKMRNVAIEHDSESTERTYHGTKSRSWRRGAWNGSRSRTRLRAPWVEAVVVHGAGEWVFAHKAASEAIRIVGCVSLAGAGSIEHA